MPTLKGFSTEKKEDLEKVKKMLFQDASGKAQAKAVQGPKEEVPQPAEERGGIIETLFGKRKKR